MDQGPKRRRQRRSWAEPFKIKMVEPLAAGCPRGI